MTKEKLTINMMIEQVNMLEAQGRGHETGPLRERIKQKMEELQR